MIYDAKLVLHYWSSQAWPDPRVNGGSGKLCVQKLCQVLWLGWGWNGAEHYMEDSISLRQYINTASKFTSMFIIMFLNVIYLSMPVMAIIQRTAVS